MIYFNMHSENPLSSTVDPEIKTVGRAGSQF